MTFYQSQQPNFPTNFCYYLKHITNKIKIKLNKIKIAIKVLQINMSITNKKKITEKQLCGSFF